MCWTRDTTFCSKTPVAHVLHSFSYSAGLMFSGNMLLLECGYSNVTQWLQQDENSCLVFANMPTHPSTAICGSGDMHWKYILVVTAGHSHCAQIPSVLLSERVCQVLHFASRETEMWPNVLVPLENQTETHNYVSHSGGVSYNIWPEFQVSRSVYVRIIPNSNMVIRGMQLLLWAHLLARQKECYLFSRIKMAYFRQQICCCLK